MACKRQFVIERYEYSKSIKKPSVIHEWWLAMFVCPMCSGFWISLITAPFFFKTNIIFETLAAYGLNWILHCLEDSLYWIGKNNQNKNEERN